MEFGGEMTEKLVKRSTQITVAMRRGPSRRGESFRILDVCTRDMKRGRNESGQPGDCGLKQTWVGPECKVTAEMTIFGDHPSVGIRKTRHGRSVHVRITGMMKARASRCVEK